MTISTEVFPTLPALRSLGKLADLRPIVVIDNREQTPLVFTNLPSVPGTLTSGDYANPRAVLASCDTFEVRYSVPFVFVNDDVAALVERWVFLFCREVVTGAYDLLRGVIG